MVENTGASQTQDIFDIMAYNDRMIENKFKYEHAKKNLTTCVLSSGFVMLLMLLFEVVNSSDKDKFGMGVTPMLLLCAVGIPLLIIILKKLICELFLVIAAAAIVFAIVTFSLFPLIIGALNAALYFCTRSINEVKELQGYPLFLTKPIPK